MSGSIYLIYDKTLKVIRDILHVKSAAILRIAESDIYIERLLSHGRMKNSDHDSIGQREQLVDEITDMNEPALIPSTLFENTPLIKAINEDHYYVFPCLDSHMTVIALIILPVPDPASFDAENYALVQVVGQRLSVELEKNRVIREQERLSEFNASILESLDEVTWDYSIVQKKISWFGAIQNVFGCQKEDMGHDLDIFLDKIHPSDRAAVEEQLVMNRHADRKFQIDFQFESNGDKFNWLRIEGIMHCDIYGNAERVIGVIKNVHNEKLAEILRIRAMIKAKDSERKRIASEIHDSLGQTLSVARLELDSLADQLKEEGVRAKIENVSKLVAGAIQESRAISHDLMPPALVDYGLIPALETMINQLNRSSNVNFNFFHNEISERFEEEFETNLYRICQEGVNNILKHAQAKNATVQVIRHPNSVYVSIEDDGIGFPKNKEGSGLGLKNMANRVAYLGGKIDFESNNGSIITIEISI